MPSVPQAATPMKPRANPGNRTRQPKGRANRLAKPARLSRASQDHLMMIVLNKTVAATVAATVAQHDLEPLAVHAQSETTAYERHVLCANFSKTRALFLLLSHRPQQKGRAGAPLGGGVCCICNIGMVVRLCSGVSCVIARGAIVIRRDRLCARRGRGARGGRPSCRCRRVVPGRGRRRSRRRGLCTCHRCAVAKRRWMLVFAIVLAWSVLSWFAI